MVSRYNTRKYVKTIQKANNANRGVVEYRPCNVEDFFDESEFPGNILLTGQNANIRNRAISRVIECSLNIGYSPIVLHMGDADLETMLMTLFGPKLIRLLNAGNPYYDPFIGLSNGEISYMVTSAMKNSFALKGQGKYYLDAMSDFLRARKIEPYLAMYIACPHMSFIDAVNSAEQKGTISGADAGKILSEIAQGQSESGNIANYFSLLGTQIDYMLAKKKNLPYAVSLRTSAESRQIPVIDLVSETNAALIDLIALEISALMSAGRKIMLILDGVGRSASETLRGLIKNSGYNFLVTLSADDAYSAFDGNDNDFFSFLGKTFKVVVSAHSSAYSCQKIADIFGYYDKNEISAGFSRYPNSWGGMSNVTQSANVSVKRENKVKPEEISRLPMNEVFILSRSRGEIARAVII